MFEMSSPPDMEALRFYLLMPLYHEFNNAESYSEIHTPFGRSFLKMTEVARKVVLHWWDSAPVILSLLQDLFRINGLDRKEPVPIENFYIQGLADSVHLQDDFCNYSTSQNVIIITILMNRI